MTSISSDESGDPTGGIFDGLFGLGLDSGCPGMTATPNNDPAMSSSIAAQVEIDFDTLWVVADDAALL